MRQGASWMAASHRQLTVAAVARPVRPSVGASASLPLSGPGRCSPGRRLPGGASSPIESSGVVAVVDTASSHATASVAGVQHAVSTHPVSASGIRLSDRPVSGHLGSSSRGPTVGRLLSTRAVSSRLVSAPRPSGRVRILSPQAVAVETRSRWPGDPDHQNRWRPLRLPGRRRLPQRSRRPARRRRCPSRGGQWEVGGGPGPPGWVRAAAAALVR